MIDELMDLLERLPDVAVAFRGYIDALDEAASPVGGGRAFFDLDPSEEEILYLDYMRTARPRLLQNVGEYSYYVQIAVYNMRPMPREDFVFV
jgi:hypothetical protein